MSASTEYVGRASEHPNYERALAAIGERFPDHVVNHWRGLYGARPWWLDLDTTCPRCGAEPFWPCTTPSSYLTRTHRQRRA